MATITATLVRLAAVVIALAIGFVFGALTFIDTEAPSALSVALTIGGWCLVGAALQLGLFFAPFAARRTPTVRIVVTLLMLPTPVLLGVQMAQPVQEVMREGLGVVGRFPPSDQRLFGAIIVIAAIYLFAAFAMWKRSWPGWSAVKVRPGAV